MKCQGDGASAPDWWSELYDESERDTGSAAAGDSIDDRFDSAARAVAEPSALPSPDRGRGPADPPTRAEPVDATTPPAPPQDLDASPTGDLPSGSGTEPDASTGTPPESDPPPGAKASSLLPRPANPPAPPARSRRYLGDRPPAYEPEPTTLPPADPHRLDELAPDTVLDGATHGELTVRAVSTRGDFARYRGRPRGEALLSAKFGTGDSALLLLALASGSRAVENGHLAARELCEWIGEAVGLSHARLSEDLRLERRSALKSGLGRLTSRGLGRLRASATERDLDPGEYAAGLRCLLLPADPRCQVRLFFGVGGGGLFRLREGEWRDLEPVVSTPAPSGEEALNSGPGSAMPSTPPFLFRTVLAEPGDALLLCTEGMADPVRAEGELRAELARRWSAPEPPGLAGFLLDTRLRATGHAEDRSVVGVWEASRHH